MVKCTPNPTFHSLLDCRTRMDPGRVERVRHQLGTASQGPAATASAWPAPSPQRAPTVSPQLDLRENALQMLPGNQHFVMSFNRCAAMRPKATRPISAAYSPRRCRRRHARAAGIGPFIPGACGLAGVDTHHCDVP